MKFLISLIFYCLFGVLFTNGQNCMSLDELVSVFQNSNDEILIAKKKLVISTLAYKNELTTWNWNSKVDFSLPYNKSIETVVSSDGNANYVQREYSSPLATISTSKKIALTGGEIGVNANLGLFKNFINSGVQYNTNWFNVTLSQPIVSFNEFKFEKKKQKFDVHIDSIEYLKIREEKTASFIEVVIDYELLKLNLKNIEGNLFGKKELLSSSKVLFENGRALETDTLIASYVVEKSLVEMAKYELQLIEKRRQLSNMIKQEYSFVLCDISKVKIYNLDSVFFNEIFMKYNHEKSLNLDSFLVHQNLKRVKKSNGITTGVIAGIGANKSATDFNQLFLIPSQRENFALTTSIPITGWSSYKRNKQIAKIEKDIYELNKAQVDFNSSVWSKSVVENYYYLLSLYRLSQKNIGIQERSIKSTEFKSNAGNVNFAEYRRMILEMDNALFEQFDLLKQLQLIRFKIRAEVLFDLDSNKFLY